MFPLYIYVLFFIKYIIKIKYVRDMNGITWLRNNSDDFCYTIKIPRKSLILAALSTVVEAADQRNSRSKDSDFHVAS